MSGERNRRKRKCSSEDVSCTAASKRRSVAQLRDSRQLVDATDDSDSLPLLMEAQHLHTQNAIQTIMKLTECMRDKSQSRTRLYLQIQKQHAATTKTIKDFASQAIDEVNSAVEDFLSNTKLRCLVLEEHIANGLEHRVTSRKKNGFKLAILPGGGGKSNAELESILVQTMVDKETEAWKPTWQGEPDGKRLCHNFRKRSRGQWTTAAHHVLKERSDRMHRICITPVDPVNTCDRDETADNNVDFLDDSVHTAHSTCTECGSSATLSTTLCPVCNSILETLGECAAVGCHERICERCSYCSICNNLVLDWESRAEEMQDSDYAKMQEHPLNLQDNSQVNVWHFYKKRMLDSLQLLPMSMSANRIKTDNDLRLKNFWRLNENKVPIMSKSSLNDDRKQLQEQFRRLQLPTGPLEYVNKPEAIHLAKVDGHITNTISKLSASDAFILTHSLRHADYHSKLKLMRRSDDPTVLSVVCKAKIPAGTFILEYGGVVHAGAHITEVMVGDSSKSFTWTVLKHSFDEGRDIVLYPLAKSNLGRFINGTRADEQHKVNVAIKIVRDEEGQAHVILIALRDIQPGEHLFYFYGDYYPTEWLENGINAEFLTIEQFTNRVQWEDVP